jgi:hypothetical protein
MPATASVRPSIHATFDHVSPSRSPAIVALVFQSICVARFHACAPAWLRIASPTVWPPWPWTRCMRILKASSA